jgi:hypothetical protein
MSLKHNVEALVHYHCEDETIEHYHYEEGNPSRLRLWQRNSPISEL